MSSCALRRASSSSASAGRSRSASALRRERQKSADRRGHQQAGEDDRADGEDAPRAVRRRRAFTRRVWRLEPAFPASLLQRLVELLIESIGNSAQRPHVFGRRRRDGRADRHQAVVGRRCDHHQAVLIGPGHEDLFLGRSSEPRDLDAKDAPQGQVRDDRCAFRAFRLLRGIPPGRAICLSVLLRPDAIERF